MADAEENALFKQLQIWVRAHLALVALLQQLSMSKLI